MVLHTVTVGNLWSKTVPQIIRAERIPNVKLFASQNCSTADQMSRGIWFSTFHSCKNDSVRKATKQQSNKLIPDKYVSLIWLLCFTKKNQEAELFIHFQAKLHTRDTYTQNAQRFLHLACRHFSVLAARTAKSAR